MTCSTLRQTPQLADKLHGTRAPNRQPIGERNARRLSHNLSRHEDPLGLNDTRRSNQMSPGAPLVCLQIRQAREPGALSPQLTGQQGLLAAQSRHLMSAPTLPKGLA